MPISDEEKLNVERGAQSEVIPEVVLFAEDSETLPEAESYITAEAAELRVLLQSALDSLPSISDEPERLRELNEIQAELNRLEQSFLSRLGSFLSSPVEGIKKWKAEKKEKQLGITDNPRIINELRSGLKKIQANIVRWKKEHQAIDSIPEDVYRDSFDQIFFLYAQASKQDFTKWECVDDLYRQVLNLRLNHLLKEGGFDDDQTPLEKKNKGILIHVLDLWKTSPDGNTDMAHKIYLAVGEYFEQRIKKAFDEEKNKSLEDGTLVNTLLLERAALLNDHPDINAYFVLGIGRYNTGSKVGMHRYTEQLDVLKKLKNLPQRKSIVAEFDVESYRTAGIRQNLIEHETKRQLFESYLKYNKDKIIFNIDFFQDEVSALHIKEQDVLWKRAGEFTNDLMIFKFLSYITVDRNTWHEIFKTCINGRLSYHGDFPLIAFTNPHIMKDLLGVNGSKANFDIAQKERERLLGKPCTSEKGGLALKNSKFFRDVEALCQLIKKNDKYPDFSQDQIRESLFLLAKQCIDIHFTDPRDQRAALDVFEEIQEAGVLLLQQTEELKNLFFRNFSSADACVDRIHDQYLGLMGLSNHNHTRRVSQSILFFRDYFGVDMEQETQHDGVCAVVDKILKDGGPALVLDMFIVMRTTSNPREFPQLDETQLKDILDKIITEGDGKVLARFVKDVYKKDRLIRDRKEQRVLLNHSLLYRGFIEELEIVLSSINNRYHVEELHNFSIQDIEYLKQRVLNEGNGKMFLYLLRVEKKNIFEEGITKEQVASKFITQCTVEDIVDAFCDIYPEGLSEEQYNSLYKRVLNEGSQDDFLALSTSDRIDQEKRRCVLDKLLLIMDSRISIQVLDAPMLRALLTSSDIDVCIGKITEIDLFSKTTKLTTLSDYSTYNLGVTQIQKRVVSFLENPERMSNFAFFQRIPADFAYNEKESIKKRADIMRDEGFSAFANALERCILCEEFSDFQDEWKKFLSLIDEVAVIRKELNDLAFNEVHLEDKNYTASMVASFLEGIANKNLKNRLRTVFLEKPTIFSKDIFLNVPKESYPTLNLLKGQFSLDDSQVGQFAGEFFTGQVVKKSTDRDRFNYFLLEGKNSSELMKNFLEASIPLMQRCPDSKRKLFSLSQLLRSYGFLEGGFANRLQEVNQRIGGINQEYDNFLQTKRQDWAEPVRQELQILQQEQSLDSESKKIKSKIIKKLAQLERGPDTREESVWKREFNIIALQKLDALVHEYDAGLPSVFRKRCGVDLTPEQVNRFLEKFKDIGLVFIYFGKLSEYPEQEKLFKKFIESVAKGELSQVRYQNREHLDKVFSGDLRLEKLWSMNSRLERNVDGMEEGEGVTKETMAKQRIKEFITEALRHNHVEGEYAKILTQYTEADDMARQKMKKNFESRVKDFSSGEEKTDEQKTLIAIFNTMKLLSARASELKQGSLKEKQGTETKETKIEDLLKEIENAFTTDSPFQEDIRAIRQVTSELKNEKKQTANVLNSLRAEESEDPDMLLRLGTDVIGSCQNVNGSPSLNRNLISYIMDGKVKTIFVRDASGDIVSRAIMRILYDEKIKRPVINLEHSYHRSDAPVTTSNELLFSLAQEKAHKMGVDLVISGKFRSGQELPTYNGELRSYGGPGDTEYVDTIGGSHKDQKYTIPGSSVFLVPKGKPSIQLDSSQGYQWRSVA